MTETPGATCLVPYNKQFSCQRNAVAAALPRATFVMLIYPRATCGVCLHAADRSSSKEWLSSRPIDRLESKITRFLAASLASQFAHHCAIRRVELRSLFSLFSPFFFIKAKAVARCGRVLLFPPLRSLLHSAAVSLYARRYVKPGLISIFLWNSISRKCMTGPSRYFICSWGLIRISDCKVFRE